MINTCVRLDVARPGADLLAPSRARVVMFGFAGASIMSLQSLARAFPPELEIWGVEYPGRGMRWQQALPHDLDNLLRQMRQDVESLSEVPLIFMGYSMGAHVAYRLALQCPHLASALVVLSARAPHSAAADWYQRPLSDAELIGLLVALGGMPTEVLASPTLMEYFLPIMRADLALCAEMSRTAAASAAQALDCPLLVLQGEQDRLVPDANIALWHRVAQRHTTQAAGHAYPGGHFFHQGIETELAADIIRWLSSGPLAHAVMKTARPDTPELLQASLHHDS